MTCCWTLPICLMFSLNCWGQRWTQHSMCNLNSTEWNWVTTALLLLIMPLQIAAGNLVYPHCCSSALLIMFNLLCTRTPSYLSSRQFPSHTDFSLLRAHFLRNSKWIIILSFLKFINSCLTTLPVCPGFFLTCLPYQPDKCHKQTR